MRTLFSTAAFLLYLLPAGAANLVLIPEGDFVMGNATNVFPAAEGNADELPQHTVHLSAYYIESCEVTKALWSEVYQWATNNGYAFENAGSGKATNHPVYMVNWYDCLKWCNARSEKEGLTPCYTTNGVTYKRGNNSSVTCNWSATGYRLPTEAEWEKAARGGVADTRFPWTDYTNKISHAKANYRGASGTYSYDLSTGYHPAYTNGGMPYTSPVGSFAPNGYGVYDMAGNMFEWIWDWYSSSYYSISPSADPRGPASGSWRMLRGGSWRDAPAHRPRCSYRYGAADPVAEDSNIGFRCVIASAITTTRVIRLVGALSYGSVPVGSTSNRSLTICNDGNAPLNVTSITYPSDFTGAWSGAVAAGSSQNVTVVFSPTNAQFYTGTITVNSDATSGENTTGCSGMGVATSPPPDMVLIPAGTFAMGNATNVFPASEGNSDELPQHTVHLNSFYMDRCEVTKAQWDEVYQWATNNGYAFENAGSGKATNHPVYMVNWYDCLKWCNARSEKEGLTPCYTTNGVTYKRGNNSSVTCNWSATGYRLPTEAEWEKAARGGVADTRFPWTDYTNKISHAKANYYGASGTYSYDLSTGYHPAYTNGGMPYTSPVGSFAPNGYGVYDMAGNIFEWIWDWYSSSYYSISPSMDPTGPASGSWRMLRGGAWRDPPAHRPRCSHRYGAADPVAEDGNIGFRCVRRSSVLPLMISPNVGPYAGGIAVLITNCVPDIGNGTDITNVTVGGVAATITGQGMNWIAIVMPAAGSTGVKDITFQSTSAGTITLTAVYTVNPAGDIHDIYRDRCDWREVAGLPAPRIYLASAVLNGSWYSVGGYNGGARTNVYRYDGINWTEVAGLPSPRAFLAAGVVSGALYAIGGDTGDAGQTNVYRYNGTNWTEVAGLPAPREYLGAGVLNGELYAIGGFSSGSYKTNVYRYNGTIWTEVAGLPFARCQMGVETLNGALYVAGGATGGSYTNVLRFDGSSWTQVAGMPAQRANLAAGVLAGSLYAIGGDNGLTNVCRFDGTNWTQVAGLPASRRGMTAGVLNNELYAAGGGESTVGRTNVYHYQCVASNVPGVDPMSGSASGGYSVRIRGSNLGSGSDVTNVTLCGVSANNIVSQSSTQIVVIVGAGSPGVGDVAVYSVSFGATVRSNAFTYTRFTQSISFASPGNQLTTNTVGLAATASSGLPVSFEVIAGPASISSGTNLSFSGTGPVSVLATQDGDSLWDPAPAVTNTFWVFVDSLTLHGVPSNITVACDAIPEPALVTAESNCGPAAQTNGLVLYFSFDSVIGTNVIDGSSFGNNGTIQGAPVQVAGVSGRAFKFNGTNDTIFTPRSSSLNVSTQFTLSAWFKAYNYAYQRPILEWCDTNAGYGAHMWCNMHGADWVGSGANLVSGAWDTGKVHIISVSDPTLNTWHHMAVTYAASSGVARLFIDGALVRTTSFGGFTATTWADFYVGNRPIISWAWWCGELDEIRVYNRALPTNEVYELYSSPGEGEGAGNLSVNFTESRTGSCTQLITRVWTAVDACGRSVSATQTITAIRTSISSLAGVPADETLYCEQALPGVPVVTAVDGCGTVAVQFAETDTGCPGTVVRTWTALDGCGNSLAATQIITRLSSSAPTLWGIPTNIIVACNAIPEPAVVTADSACGAPPETNGLVLHFSFDSVIGSTVSDLSGHGNNGSFIGSPNATAGIYGDALQFNGTSDAIFVPRSPSLNVASQMTLSVWFKTHSYDIQRPILDYDDASAGFGAHIWCNVFGSDWRGTGANLVQGNGYNGTAHVISMPNPATGVWHHIMVTYNATSGIARLYMDGALSQTATLGTFLPSTWADLYIGNRPSISWAWWRGALDEIRVYNRELSPIEAQSMYANTVPVQFDERSEGTCPRVLTRSWTAVDSCGGVASATQLITVIDQSSPSLVNVPANSTIPCGWAPPPIPAVVALDDCGDAPVEYSEVTNGVCPATLTRTWTATDGCGNVTSASQIITFRAPTDHFVSTNGAAVSPFTNWATAARSIQDAINVCLDGDRVWVNQGRYLESIHFGGRNVEVSSLYLTSSDTSLVRRTIIDAGLVGRVATFDDGESSASLLAGFTLVNGWSHGVQGHGGGVACVGSSPRLSNLIIAGNTSDGNGGGIYLQQSDAQIRNISLSSNQAVNGGAVMCSSGAPLLSGIRARWNMATSNGGCLYLSRVSSPLIASIAACENSADSLGGAIFLSECAPDLQNLTLIDNDAPAGGGSAIAVSYGAQPNLINSIIFGNTYDQIVFDPNWISMSLTVDHSDIEGGSAAIITHGLGPVLWQDGNISLDPQLDEFLRLTASSPCIDMGTNAPWMNKETDLNGNARILGDSVDMGACEYTTNDITGSFGTLTCVISPPEAQWLGAAWQITSGGATGWFASGASALLPPGPAYVTFRPVSGWITPADTNVVLSATSNTTISTTYVQESADIVPPSIIHIAPPDGHVSSGNQIPMTIIVTDNVAIAFVLVNEQSTEASGDHVYHFTATGVRGNFNSFVIKAVDTAGNTATQTVNYGNASGLELSAVWNGYWRVLNPFTNTVAFTWGVKNDSECGSGVATANSDTYFGTTLGPKVVILYVNGEAVAQAPWSPSDPPAVNMNNYEKLKRTDSDLDGVSNYEEELAGSSSSDSDSSLTLTPSSSAGSQPMKLGRQLLGLDPESDQMVVFSWYGNSNNIYSVESSIDLDYWTVVPWFIGVPGNNRTMYFTNQIPVGGPTFMRLRAGKRP